MDDAASGWVRTQLRQPVLDPVSGENLTDIESSSSVGEDAEATPKDTHEMVHEPAARVRSRRRHPQEHARKRSAHHSGQHLLVSRLATYAPLIAVFLLALLMGFAGRVLLPQQQQQSIPVASVMSGILSQASAAAQPAVHRRRLIALSSPFRVNPLAGQVPKLKPGSGPMSRRSSDGTLGVEDENALLLDPEMMAPHALGAPAARLPEQAQQASQKSQISQQAEQAVWAMAAESAPEFANLGRRLAPGSAPGPAGPAIKAAIAPETAVAIRAPIRDEEGRLLPLAQPLKVCLMSADFPGLPNAGHISTAFTLLAAALGTDPSLKVTLLGVSKDLEACGRMANAQRLLNPSVDYTCLKQEHFEPFTVATQPFEQLSHAVLKWLVQHQESCDIVQVHEWGGTFKNLVMHAHFRRFRPGLRVAVSLFGGHYWRTQWMLPRPTDIMSLRLDNTERQTVELADIILSSTRYMASWLRQRSWVLPQNRLAIPSMVPGAEMAPTERAERPVWQLAYYAPLEETKGIKIFCDAVEQLPRTVLDRPGFEVFILGEEGKIDQKLSLPWIRDRTASWGWKTHVLPSPTKQRAMSAINKEGMLVVFASPLENVPYTLAEVAVMGIPLLTFDVGGATELIDPKTHEDLFCGMATVGNLVPCIRNALLKGYLAPPVLAPRIVEAREQWLDWHHDFAANQLPGMIAKDQELARKVEAMDNKAEIVIINPDETALQLYEHVCDERECTDIGCANPDIPGAVLLKPAEYEIMDESRLPELVKLLSVGQLTGSPVGGLTFGAHVPEIKKRGERVSYPSGPTWQIYEGKIDPWVMSDNCTDNVPVLIKRATFCSAFAADARDFRQYNSWVLSLMLEQSGMHLGSFPETPFRLKDWTVRGSHCVLDKAPDRMLDIQVAANLLTDDVLMRSYQLTPEYRPLVDLHSDLAPTQGNKGWFFGYSDALLGSTATFRAFKYEAHGNGQLQDGRWMVREDLEYPQVHRLMLHPCVSNDERSINCGDFFSATSILRFQSFFTQKRVVASYTFEVHPHCGDGVEISVLYADSQKGTTEVLHAAEYAVQQAPVRQRVLFFLDHLHTGDKLDFVVWPKDDHDCDAALLLEAKIWDSSEFKETTTF
ncbi:g88 [Coccomyxa viridis]|uniref:G88 protein n=1 Tax=Coccomyxa viridis TaxID=1274662 RepID=A0ABP1FLD7_9CHLO